MTETPRHTLSALAQEARNLLPQIQAAMAHAVEARAAVIADIDAELKKPEAETRAKVQAASSLSDNEKNRQYDAEKRRTRHYRIVALKAARKGEAPNGAGDVPSIESGKQCAEVTLFEYLSRIATLLEKDNRALSDEFKRFEANLRDTINSEYDRRAWLPHLEAALRDLCVEGELDGEPADSTRTTITAWLERDEDGRTVFHRDGREPLKLITPKGKKAEWAELMWTLVNAQTWTVTKTVDDLRGQKTSRKIDHDMRRLRKCLGKDANEWLTTPTKTGVIGLKKPVSAKKPTGPNGAK